MSGSTTRPPAANSTITADASTRCYYCRELIDSDEFLQCLECSGNVHIKCLRHASTPGALLGDVFFDFTCAKCMQLQTDVATTSSNALEAGKELEQVVRQRLPWFMVITLTLYNMSLKSKGIGRQGYFHWRSHIANFVEKNWEYLFEAGTRRRKNWIGSISGNLSHNSPDFFQSGQEVFNEPGWWRLTHVNQTPKYIYEIYEQLSLKRQQLRNDKRLQVVNDTFEDSNELPDIKRVRRNNSDDELPQMDSCSRTIPYMGRKPKAEKLLNIVDDDLARAPQAQIQRLKHEPYTEREPLNTVQSSLMDFLAENLGGDDLTMFQHLPNIAPEPLVEAADNTDFIALMEVGAHENVGLFDEPYIKGELELPNCDLKQEQPSSSRQVGYGKREEPLTQQPELSESSDVEDIVDINADTDDDDDDEFKPRIVQVTNFQQMDKPPTAPASLTDGLLNGKHIKQEVNSETEPTDDEEDMKPSTSTQKPCKPSLFTKHTRRKWPWLAQPRSEQEDEEPTDDTTETSKENLMMISEYEEAEMLSQMREVFACEQKCQLKIPTYIRRFYRKLCVREWNREHNRPVFNLDKLLQTGMGQRADQESKSNVIDRYQLISLTAPNARKSFYARIAGSCHYELFQSPYTQRILHPFIYRNKECFPPWLKLMCEVQHAVTGLAPPRAPIDFCYVRPNYIAAVNALLQTAFWPGIDMSDCLSYPDYSVVALYKKLVVGCGFLVPDVGFNEAYISFMAVRPNWQRSGIATFMLYHLIQTCMSKDITLHVSATNPAVVLYQKFGFKIEEVILGFYDKYLPIDSKHSRNAFFLRLMR